MTAPKNSTHVNDAGENQQVKNADLSKERVSHGKDSLPAEAFQGKNGIVDGDVVGDLHAQEDAAALERIAEMRDNPEKFFKQKGDQKSRDAKAKKATLDSMKPGSDESTLDKDAVKDATKK